MTSATLGNSMSKSVTPSPPETAASSAVEPLSAQRIGRAFTGSVIAGTFALLFLKMLRAIATAFANKPVVSDNVTVVNLSAAVRTLVMGVIALGTGVFAMAAIGLLLLGLQMIWQRLTKQSPLPDQATEPSD